MRFLPAWRKPARLSLLKEAPVRLKLVGWMCSTIRTTIVAVGSVVLATAAFSQSPLDTEHLVFDPLLAIRPARGATGSSFKDLVIGQATRSMVVAALGRPTG